MEKKEILRKQSEISSQIEKLRHDFNVELLALKVRQVELMEIVSDKKQKPDLPKSWEELGETDGWYYDDSLRICHIMDFPKSKEWIRCFPTKAEAEASIALAQLCQLRDRYNDGWNPDWQNSDDIWVIFFKGELAYVGVTDRRRDVLRFKSKELAEQFLENFRDLIEKAKPLL